MITSDNFYKALEIGFTFQRIYKQKGQPPVVLSPSTVNGKVHRLRCSTCSIDAAPRYHHITQYLAYTVDFKKRNIKPYSSCALKVGQDDDRSASADMQLICLWCHRSFGIATFEVDTRFCNKDCFEAYKVNSEVQTQTVSIIYKLNPPISIHKLDQWLGIMAHSRRILLTL